MRQFVFFAILFLIALAYVGDLVGVSDAPIARRTTAAPAIPRIHIEQIAHEPLPDPDSELRWTILKWSVLILPILAAIAAIMRLLIIPAWKDAVTIKPDDKGMFPMLRGKYSGRDEHGHKVKYDFYHDQNSSVTPGTIIAKNGSVNILPQMDGDVQMHAEYSAKQLAYLGMRAMGHNPDGGKGRGLNRAETRLLGGVVAQEARKAAADAERSEMRLLQMQQKALPTPEPTPIKPPTMQEAIATSKRNGFVVGYRDDGTVCKIDLPASIHVAIIGSTGTGKTSSIGLKMIVDCLRHDYQTIILDGMGGEDLDIFKGHCEWHASTPENFYTQMAQIDAEFQRRIAISDKAIKAKLPSIALFIEEFNELWEHMTEDDQEQTLRILKHLLRKGRHAKIHMIIIGQEPEGWPKLLMNIKSKVVFSLGLAEAQRVSEWEAQRLPNNGAFLHRGQQFKAWLWKDQVMQYIPRNGRNGAVSDIVSETFQPFPETARNGKETAKKRQETARNDLETAGNVSGNDAGTGSFSLVEADSCQNETVLVSETVRGVPPPEKAQKGTPPSVTVSAVSTVSDVPIPLQRLWDKTHDAELVGKKYFILFNNGSQSQLRKLLASLSGRKPDAYKKLAHTLYHNHVEQK